MNTKVSASNVYIFAFYLLTFAPDASGRDLTLADFQFASLIFLLLPFAFYLGRTCPLPSIIHL